MDPITKLCLTGLVVLMSFFGVGRCFNRYISKRARKVARQRVIVFLLMLVFAMCIAEFTTVSYIVYIVSGIVGFVWGEESDFDENNNDSDSGNGYGPSSTFAM